jgi:hypothetical protein
VRISSPQKAKTIDTNQVLYLGMMEANAAISLTMSVQLINRLLHGYYHNDSQILHLLTNREVWVIPYINADGYQFIWEKYKATHVLSPVFKNRRGDQTDAEMCGESGLGVSLMNNFDFFWGVDEDGSSNAPCDPHYRGSMAHSEPEVKTILNFLSDKQFRIAVNMLR